jgi:hypothetical protein
MFNAGIKAKWTFCNIMSWHLVKVLLK